MKKGFVMSNGRHHKELIRISNRKMKERKQEGHAKFMKILNCPRSNNSL